MTKQSMYYTSFATQLSFIIGCKLALIDPIAIIAAIVLEIGIGYELRNVNRTAIRIDICNKIQHNWDRMHRITVGSHVFNEIEFVIAIIIDILIKLSPLSPFLNALSIVFDGIIFTKYK